MGGSDCASLIVFFEVLSDGFLARQSVYKRPRSLYLMEKMEMRPSLPFVLQHVQGWRKGEEPHLLFSLKSDGREVRAHLGHSSSELGATFHPTPPPNSAQLMIAQEAWLLSQSGQGWARWAAPGPQAGRNRPSLVARGPVWLSPSRFLKLPPTCCQLGGPGCGIHSLIHQ